MSLHPDFEAIVEQEKEYLRKIHPTSADIPTCFQHFDRMIMCGGVKAQVKSVYRYGRRPDCDWHIEEFKQCLMMKFMNLDERRDVWIQRRAEWWANRRLTMSSEDIWDMRKPGEQSKKWPIPISEYYAQQEAAAEKRSIE